jgi:hypothetical protein
MLYSKVSFTPHLVPRIHSFLLTPQPQPPPHFPATLFLHTNNLYQNLQIHSIYHRAHLMYEVYLVNAANLGQGVGGKGGTII